MVNTRRKSQAPVDDGASQLAEQSDSSSTSVTRRSTRRSVGVVPTLSEIATPPRRSRRLSNSSVESVNNDTPRPATRRSTRNKPAGSDTDTNEVELVVIKRRKVVEGVDTLNPISEEKAETERPSQDSQPTQERSQGIIKLDEEDLKGEKGHKHVEITILESPQRGKAKEILNLVDDVRQEAEINAPVKLAESPLKIGSPQKQTVLTEDNVLNPEDANKSEATPGPPLKDDCEIQMEVANNSISETPGTPTKQFKNEEVQSVIKTQSPVHSAEMNSPAKVVVEEVMDKLQLSPMEEEPTKEVMSPKTVVNSPLKDLNIQNKETEEKLKESEPSEEKMVEERIVLPAASPTQKPKLLFGIPSDQIKTGTKLKLSKKSKKLRKQNKEQDPLKQAVTVKKALPPPKPALPCNADIMRNIPRGKSKSGREWKEPKSNPRYLYQDKGLKMPLEKITQVREEKRRVKELENRLKEEERARRAEITRRREINKKREEENAKRGEIVQVIRNTNKIKRMKKKQLKLIQKRDTTVV